MSWRLESLVWGLVIIALGCGAAVMMFEGGWWILPGALVYMVALLSCLGLIAAIARPLRER